MELSELQERLLDWIEDYICQYGYSPARREMKAAMGYKTLSSIQNHLFALREQGYVAWKEGQSRSIQVLRPRTAKIPIVGTIAAHSLVETFSDAEVEYVDLSSLLLPQRRSRHEISQYFALRVRAIA
jgi:repressor LexA